MINIGLSQIFEWWIWAMGLPRILQWWIEGCPKYYRTASPLAVPHTLGHSVSIARWATQWVSQCGPHSEYQLGSQVGSTQWVSVCPQSEATQWVYWYISVPTQWVSGVGSHSEYQATKPVANLGLSLLHHLFILSGFGSILGNGYKLICTWDFHLLWQWKPAWQDISYTVLWKFLYWRNFTFCLLSVQVSQ